MERHSFLLVQLIKLVHISVRDKCVTQENVIFDTVFY